MSKNDGDFHCLNCIHSFRTKNKFVNKFFLGVAMPSEEIKILEFNQYQKSYKTRSIIYADFESLIKK